ncbi:uncharacterized protein LOC128548339 [Mercenaria mercenaria]|uniref:uncharacterized protein LOC128548339 n=1 Tax=Mercenaria mercenaria TaxID=6596 RepID=UPI00234E546A|nr:uncharacterized protein LOC128548339 [Mercenaria mercenaria]
MSVPGLRHDGENRTNKLLSVSGRNDAQTVGSDIEYDFVCDPCEEEGHRFEAYGFCSDCNHYLCETCYTAHRRPIPMRNHKLLDKNDMPKVRPKPTSVNNEVIEEKCDVHVGKFVEFYCGNHDTIGCSVCMTLEHKSCDSVQFVPDMKVDNDKFDEIMKQLTAMSSNAKAAQVSAKERVLQTNDSFDNVLQEGKRFCKMSKDFIESLEKNFEKTAQIEREKVIEEVESTIDSLEKTAQHAESLSKELISYRSLKKDANLFIAVKKAEKGIECSSLEDILCASKGSNTGYVFIPDKVLYALLQKIHCIGIVEPTSKQTTAEPSASIKFVTCSEEFSAHAKDDTSDCIIAGISNIYEPVRNIIADAGNNKIKVIKGCSNAITASLKLSAKPHAMTELDLNKVCVTIPEEKKILVISVSKLFRKDTIKIAKSLECRGKCYGVATYGSAIYVTCEYDDGRFAINYMNTKGQTVNLIKCSDNEPMYIAVRKDHLYTLDTKHTRLKSLSQFDGSTINELKIKNVTHFTVTDNFLIVVVDLPQGLRAFDYDLQEIHAEGSITEGKIAPICIGNYGWKNWLYAGYNNGQIKKVAPYL